MSLDSVVVAGILFQLQNCVCNNNVFRSNHVDLKMTMTTNIFKLEHLLYFDILLWLH